MKNQKSKIPIFQVDAFTDRAFQGNPAAVCLLEENNSFSDLVLQKIAQEMNLSETAFVYVKELDQITNQSKFKLRWFTPNKEVKIVDMPPLLQRQYYLMNSMLQVISLNLKL